MRLRLSKRYGEINQYKEKTYKFNNSLRGIFAVLQDLSTDLNVSADQALALCKREMTLSAFTPVDELVSLYLPDTIKEFCSNSKLGAKIYILRVLEVMLRLSTRNGYDALEVFELASLVVRDKRETKVSVPKMNVPVLHTLDLDIPEVEPQREPEQKPQKIYKTKKSQTPVENIKPKPVKKAEPKPVKKAEPTKLDDLLGSDVLARSRETLAKSKETLAKSGQTVETNPLLSDFL